MYVYVPFEKIHEPSSTCMLSLINKLSYHNFLITLNFFLRFIAIMHHQFVTGYKQTMQELHTSLIFFPLITNNISLLAKFCRSFQKNTSVRWKKVFMFLVAVYNKPVSSPRTLPLINSCQ